MAGKILKRILLTAAVFAGVAINAAPAAVVRVNQIGFLPGDSKEAFLMSAIPESNATFQVVSAGGTIAFTAPVGTRTGFWNSNYPDIYRLDFSALKTAGNYSIKVNGAAPAISPMFQIGSGRDLYSPLLRNSLFFFQAQRDGADVSSAVINRQPSHLTDTNAFAYKIPNFGKNGLQGGLEKIAGSMDVSGGWFDAGDYLKFVETASYVTALMLEAARDFPAQAGRGGVADFSDEGKFGLDWLLKMWDDKTQTLHAQVGIGDGNQNITGDHDVWRLPEADDKLNVQPGNADYFIKYRPVFPANAPGAPISPNLAGRLTAAFALGYQIFKTNDPAYAEKLLVTAEKIYSLAATTNVTELTTAFPHDFYPEDEWRDDMELGAVELYFALADGNAPSNLPDKNAAHFLQLAAHWARAYSDDGNHDSLNLYDVSALAHFELCRAMGKSGDASGLEISRDEMISDLKAQLDSAAKRSGKDPFALGLRYSTGDLVPHVLGLALEANFYDELTGTKTFQNFSREQLDFVLGANAWGTSFIVGAGKMFPFHMQHQVANLAGSLDGTPPVVLGATVDGPARGKSSKGDVPDGARPTPWPNEKNPYAEFSGNGVQFTDDVSSWATVEPADDYTAPTVLIFARQASQ